MERKRIFKPNKVGCVVKGELGKPPELKTRYFIDATYQIFAEISENYDLTEFPYDVQNINFKVRLKDC